MNGKYGIKKVGEADSMCFRNKPEHSAIAVETPWPSGLRYFESWLVVPVEKLIGNSPRRVLISKFQCLRTKPLNADDCHKTIRQNAFYGRIRLKIFKFSHELFEKGRIIACAVHFVLQEVNKNRTPYPDVVAMHDEFRR